METVRLGDICVFQSGGTPSKSNSEYFNGDIPWITTVALNGDTIGRESAVDWITSKAIEKSSARIVPANSVMVGTRVGVGKVAINSITMSTSQDIISLLEIDESRWDKDFICKFIISKKAHLNSQARGATIKGIKIEVLANLELPLISLSEQKKISFHLNKITDLIDKRKQQLSKLDELVKARFVELFGLPVSNSKKWDTEKMKDIAPTVNYSGDFEETVWLLNLDMVEAQTGRIIDYLYVSENEVGNSTCTFDTSNVLYSKLRPYLNKVVIPDRCGYATSEMIPLKPNPSKIERTYLAFMLRSDEFVKMINEKVAGAKMPRVSMSDFRDFNVPVPPMELQKRFATFVEQTDKSKLEVQKSLEKLELLKKALMQKYFG